jgi:predicted enzyme related to lactoylglutathione lyase
MQTTHAQRPVAKTNNTKKPLHKLDAHTNAITWFEIPVDEMDRARKFYETVLDIKLERMQGVEEQSLFFPRLPDTIMAQSGIVSGALVKAERSRPSANGTLIYFNAYPLIQNVIDRIEPAGGKIIQPKTKNPAGYIAVFTDTEGNRVGIHAAE